MCTNFLTDVIWIKIMCAVSLANRFRAVADAFRPLKGLSSATEQLRGELHKSEVLLIASTLLAVKVENIYRNTIKCTKRLNIK